MAQNRRNTQGCIVANECGGAFGTIVIVGGAVLVGVAVYCPPAIIIATFA